MLNDKFDKLIADLPDSFAAKRFIEEFANRNPAETKKLRKNKGLLSDLLTISAFSPLLATTLLQNPTYVSWLSRQRKNSNVREKEELLESLARFALTNTQIEPSVMLSRFRRRELIRIYLKDIRGLGTIVEITEEISNLADAILEYALQISRQELDNRYGIPLETDENEKGSRASFCIVSLGKLGSKELNYSSDIDLIFIYSKNGSTTGRGTRGATTNREYFIKLAELVTKTIGRQIGEGAAYRVDLRLRPHGRVGALAISLKEASNYYKKSARMWERQVLIRSRSVAGDSEIFQKFFERVSHKVFSPVETIENALENVRRSKQQIDLEKISRNGFDVKLGAGGIREIEFIAQALQLAYGGKDVWLRSPHTLISLSRLADRKLISESELTQLYEAYDFLRRLEHRLQMENGLQTHLLPDNLEKRVIISKRMGIFFVANFNLELRKHTRNVKGIFEKIFGDEYIRQTREQKENTKENDKFPVPAEKELSPIFASFDKSDEKNQYYEEKFATIKVISEISPPFSEMLAANPHLIKHLPDPDENFQETDFRSRIQKKVSERVSFAEKLDTLREIWSQIMLEIATYDIFEKIDLYQSKVLQTQLAEASITNAIELTQIKLCDYYQTPFEHFSFAVLGLGKLGGGGMDYGSDLDLILVYDEDFKIPINNLFRGEFYSKAVEIFVTTLSSLTRQGSLYRVDLRLRPDGKNGATSISQKALQNYLENRSAIWEWLAYVKIRGVSGDIGLAKETEYLSRSIIHQKASEIELERLKIETKRIRLQLEKNKSNSKKGKEIDIKFGAGGLQDVYFTVRFLQLRDNFPDSDENRSTSRTLKNLFENQSLSEENFLNLSEGYRFISELDHHLRLTNGRSTRVPIANKNILQIISKRMKFDSVDQFLENLTFHRLNIQDSFNSIFDS